MSTIQNKRASSGLEIAILLTIAGGTLDAYTFACRGGVFANAQTGNIIRLGIFFSKQTISRMFRIPYFNRCFWFRYIMCFNHSK